MVPIFLVVLKWHDCDKPRNRYLTTRPDPKYQIHQIPNTKNLLKPKKNQERNRCQAAFLPLLQCHFPVADKDLAMVIIIVPAVYQSFCVHFVFKWFIFSTVFVLLKAPLMHFTFSQCNCFPGKMFHRIFSQKIQKTTNQTIIDFCEQNLAMFFFIYNFHYTELRVVDHSYLYVSCCLCRNCIYMEIVQDL